MGELEVLVLELATVDGLSTSAVTVCEVSTLNHEVLDDTMESRALVAEAWFTSGQLIEVLGSLRHGLSVEAYHNLSQGLVVMFDIEVHLLRSQRMLMRLHGSGMYLLGDFRPTGRCYVLRHEEKYCSENEES